MKKISRLLVLDFVNVNRDEGPAGSIVLSPSASRDLFQGRLSLFFALIILSRKRRRSGHDGSGHAHTSGGRAGVRMALLAAALAGGLFLGSGGSFGIDIGGPGYSPIRNNFPQSSGLLTIMIPLLLIGGMALVAFFILNGGKTKGTELLARGASRLRSQIGR